MIEALATVLLIVLGPAVVAYLALWAAFYITGERDRG